MLDTADLAILETYADRMNPVELRLVEEVRRLHDEAEESEHLRAKLEQVEEELEDTKGQLSDKEEEVADLERKLDAAESGARDAENARNEARRELNVLRARLLEVLDVDAEAAA